MHIQAQILHPRSIGSLNNLVRTLGLTVLNPKFLSIVRAQLRARMKISYLEQVPKIKTQLGWICFVNTCSIDPQPRHLIKASCMHACPSLL